MPKFQFAGVRPKACIHSADKLTGGATTSAIAGNWQFYLQFRNRAGYSLLSDPVLLTLQAGDRVSFTIPADARREGEHHEEWIIAGAKATLNIDARVLFSVPAWDSMGNAATLPATVTLSTDEHFGLEVQVANESALPTSPLHGMRRGLLSTGQIVAYDSRTTTWNPILPPRFTSYVNSAEGQGGANRDAGLLGDWQGVIFPDYDSGYSLPSRGKAIGYWLVNDTDFDIPSGTPISFTFRAGKFTDWQNKIIITPKGYVDILTGYLDRTGEGGSGLYEGVDQDFLYQKFNGEIVLEKTLPPNKAFYFEVAPQFSDAQLGNLVLQGETLTIYAGFSEEVSSYAPGTYGLGDFIYPEPASRKRIYPNIGNLSAEASPGAGLVKQREFRKSSSEIFFGFDANTANQQIVISGDGNCFLADEVPPYAARRALAGTVDGVGKPTPYQYSLSVNSNNVIRLNIAHPTAIRSNYPDVVAGSSLGDFNASKVYVFVRNISSGQILQFIQSIIPGSTSSNFAIGGLAGTVITVLPSPDNTFGLYEPVSFTAATEVVSSAFSTATVEVAIAYYYENTITALNHTEGCILELTGGGVVEYVQQVASSGGSTVTPEDIMILNFAF
jgi:hypothetical protein